MRQLTEVTERDVDEAISETMSVKGASDGADPKTSAPLVRAETDEKDINQEVQISTNQTLGQQSDMCCRLGNKEESTEQKSTENNDKVGKLHTAKESDASSILTEEQQSTMAVMEEEKHRYAKEKITETHKKETNIIKQTSLINGENKITETDQNDVMKYKTLEMKDAVSVSKSANDSVAQIELITTEFRGLGLRNEEETEELINNMKALHPDDKSGEKFGEKGPMGGKPTSFSSHRTGEIFPNEYQRAPQQCNRYQVVPHSAYQQQVWPPDYSVGEQCMTNAYSPQAPYRSPPYEIQGQKLRHFNEETNQYDEINGMARRRREEQNFSAVKYSNPLASQDQQTKTGTSKRQIEDDDILSAAKFSHSGAPYQGQNYQEYNQNSFYSMQSSRMPCEHTDYSSLPQGEQGDSKQIVESSFDRMRTVSMPGLNGGSVICKPLELPANDLVENFEEKIESLPDLENPEQLEALAKHAPDLDPVEQLDHEYWKNFLQSDSDVNLDHQLSPQRNCTSLQQQVKVLERNLYSASSPAGSFVAPSPDSGMSVTSPASAYTSSPPVSPSQKNWASPSSVETSQLSPGSYMEEESKEEFDEDTFKLLEEIIENEALKIKKHDTIFHFEGLGLKEFHQERLGPEVSVVNALTDTYTGNQTVGGNSYNQNAAEVTTRNMAHTRKSPEHVLINTSGGGPQHHMTSPQYSGMSPQNPQASPKYTAVSTPYPAVSPQYSGVNLQYPGAGQQIQGNNPVYPNIPQQGFLSKTASPETIVPHQIYSIDQSNRNIHPQQLTAGQQLPVSQQLAAGQQLPVRQQLTAGRQLPISQQLTAGQQLPVSQQLAAGQQLPVSQQLAAGQQLPVSQQLAAGQQLPVSQQLTAGRQLPISQQLTAGQQLPVSQQLAAGQQLPVSQQLTAGQQLPVSQQLAAGQQLPVSQQLVQAGQPQLSVNQTAPVLSTTPVLPVQVPATTAQTVIITTTAPTSISGNVSVAQKGQMAPPLQAVIFIPASPPQMPRKSKEEQILGKLPIIRPKPDASRNGKTPSVQLSGVRSNIGQTVNVANGTQGMQADHSLEELAVKSHTEAEWNKFKKMWQARRILAGITDHAKILEQDSDGDAMIHIAVVQEPAQICYCRAILEKCKKEGTLDRVINMENYSRQTPLYLAAYVNNAHILRIFLDFGADPNIQAHTTQNRAHDVEIKGAIHVAVSRGDLGLRTLATLLTAPNLNINATNSDGLTAVHYAATKHGRLDQTGLVINSSRTIRLLIRQGADVNKSDGKSGKTGLHAIIETNDLELIASVLEVLPAEHGGQGLRQQTFNGNTSLHIAAQMPLPAKGFEQEVEKRRHLLRLLIKHGADVTIKNGQGEMPMAVVSNHEKRIVDVLRTSTRRLSPASPPAVTGKNAAV